MLEDKQFKSLEDSHRAVLLLQYLCTDQAESPEHSLIFNKVLCGLSVSDPVPIRIELTDREKEVSQFLLDSVLKNWETMNHCSVENLRVAFLVRDGRLKEEDDSWTLEVEPKSYDVILNHLPWNLSLVKLPWMTNLIAVVWPTH